MPDELRIDPEIHQRAEIRREIVDDLVALIDAADSDGWPFATRVFVSRIGADLFVTDGAHRVEACRLRGLRVNVSMTTQTREQAILDGIRANGTHGAKRSPADTRKAVHSAVRQWPDWSNQVIANHMSVTAETVRRYRSEIQDGSQSAQRQGIDGIVRSPTKTRKKKETPTVEGVGLDETTESEIQRPVVTETVAVRVEAEPPQTSPVSVEQQYEQYWGYLTAGLQEHELAGLKEFVADFHGLVQSPKKDVLFQTDEEPVVPMRRRRKPTELEFEQFWKAYPRKTNKLKAKAAMDKAFKLLTGTMEPEEAAKLLVDAALVYADRCDPDVKYQMHPTSWLNAGRWSDSADSIGKKRVTDSRKGREFGERDEW